MLVQQGAGSPKNFTDVDYGSFDHFVLPRSNTGIEYALHGVGGCLAE